MRMILLLAILTLAGCASQPKPHQEASGITIAPAPVGAVTETPLTQPPPARAP